MKSLFAPAAVVTTLAAAWAASAAGAQTWALLLVGFGSLAVTFRATLRRLQPVPARAPAVSRNSRP